MNFRIKLLCRDFLVLVLGLAFSLTVTLWIYIQIKQGLLQDFNQWLPKSYAKNVISPLYNWFFLTVPLDAGVVYLLQKKSMFGSK